MERRSSSQSTRSGSNGTRIPSLHTAPPFGLERIAATALASLALATLFGTSSLARPVDPKVRSWDRGSGTDHDVQATDVDVPSEGFGRSQSAVPLAISFTLEDDLRK